jgi:hypothetical protein
VCVCPICKCQCNLAYTTDAAQSLRVRTMLETEAIQQKKEVEIQISRSVLGKPTNKVHLPVPIKVDGKMTKVLDTRLINGTKSNHRVANNRLQDDALNSKKKKPSLLHPYGDAYTLPVKASSNTAEVGYDDLQQAMKNSLG